MLPGVFCSFPPMNVRTAILSSGGPTAPFGPFTPGITWHDAQPYLSMSCLPWSILPIDSSCLLQATKITTETQRARSSPLCLCGESLFIDRHTSFRLRQPHRKENQTEDDEDH